MQILLLFAVTIASIALLVASYRIGHRLFMAVSAMVGLIAAVILGALLFDPGRGISPMETSKLSVTLNSVNATETGYRIDGVLHNDSTAALAETDFLVVRDCQPSPCEAGASTRFTLILHVPGGASYPFSHVVDIRPQPLQDSAWTLTIEGARAYRQNH